MKKEPPGKNEDLGFLIKIISDDLEKLINAELSTFGLTLSQGGVLHYLSEQKDYSATQKEIEVFMDIAHPTVTGIINRLEEKGLVTSEITVQRRLSKIVRLTQKGKDISKQADRGRLHHEALLARGLTTEERSTLASLLLKIKESISRECL